MSTESPSKLGHTPGPWSINLSPNTQHPSCIGILFNHDNERSIGINCDRQGSRKVSKEHLVSNAKLVAASTDLLEALVGLCELAKDHIPHLSQMEAYVSARAAIKKATE